MAEFQALHSSGGAKLTFDNYTLVLSGLYEWDKKNEGITKKFKNGDKIRISTWLQDCEFLETLGSLGLLGSLATP